MEKLEKNTKYILKILGNDIYVIHDWYSHTERTTDEKDRNYKITGYTSSIHQAKYSRTYKYVLEVKETLEKYENIKLEIIEETTTIKRKRIGKYK